MNDKLYKLQKVQMEIFSEVYKICLKYNLSCFLYYGSLLGAVRHSGFIPWDDDLDIVLIREDYEQLLKLLKEELPKKYYVQTDEIYMFAKVRKKYTLHEENNTAKISNKQEIFVDIFPLDSIKEKGFLKGVRLKLYNIIYRLRRVHFEIEFSNKPKKIFFNLAKVFRIISLKTYNKWLRTIIKKNSDDTSKLLYDYNLFPNDFKSKSFNYTIDDFKPGSYIKFESMEVILPINHHLILEKLYGDYMMMPPKEQRKPSHGGKINFNTKK